MLVKSNWNLSLLSKPPTYELLPFLFQPKTKMGFTPEQFVALAQSVKERKDVLFGPLSPWLTLKNKRQAWEEVVQEMASIGCYVKSYNHLRDVTWTNLRRAVLKRWEESKKTGTEGSELTECDEIVMDIIGMKSI